MQWVTRQRPKIDRLACPWLISRFIDDGAEFLFVPPHEVRRVANATGAIPFDVPGVDLTAARGGCSFDTFLAKYHLEDPALQRIAAIVRAADNDNGKVNRSVAEAAGLRAISFGLAGAVRDDHERVAHGLILYDALYRWARKEPVQRLERGLRLWLALRRDRRALAGLSPHMLQDIGLTDDDARKEIERLAWWR